MTAPNYSIQHARDLATHMKDTLIFLNSGVPEQFLNLSVTTDLLIFLESKSRELDEILSECASVYIRNTDLVKDVLDVTN